MKNFALGKYVPYDSWVHRLDPRVKIICILLLMVAIFFTFDTWAMRLAVNGAIFILASVLLACTHTRFRDLIRSLRSLWFMVIVLLIVYILVPTTTTPVFPVAWSYKGWTVYWDSFAEAGRILMRLIIMIELTMVLTSSTKPLDLTYALEWYMTPLKVFRFPAAAVAMTVSIALRFIPTLLEDTDRVMKAQTSRGVDFQHGHIWQRLTGLTALIIPLFISSFMRSEELANAMECRGYDPDAKRTRYRLLRFHFSDLLSFLVCAGILVAVILAFAYHYDVFLEWFGWQTL